jgi:hypothetical protein
VFNWSRKTRNWVASIAAAVLALTALIWWLVGYKEDVWNVFVRAMTRKFFVREMFPSWNPLHWTPFTYLLLVFVFAGLIALASWRFKKPEPKQPNDYSYRSYRDEKGKWVRRTSTVSRVTALGLAALMAFSVLYAITGWWNNDKDGARSYLGATTYYVDNPAKLPSSLNPLTKGATQVNGDGCLFSNPHDVPNCIKQGTLPDDWDTRSASMTGASIVMSRTSGSVPNTDIMDETLTYLYAQDGSGTWSAVRNGTNKQPLNGVVTWDGTNAAQACTFTGQYALNVAFGGNWGQNLDDTLAREYPGLLYTHDDMWGYCRGTGAISSREPVVVMPVTEQQSYGRRTTARAAGVLIITGSPTGEPKIEHRSSVKAGDLPGPSYPITLVAQQRDMLQWSAGRGNKNRLNFGYEPSNVASQAGNNSEYLLRDRTSGRLFWVTPLTPRGSASQLLISYSITSADETSTGGLNPQRVYVLSDNDPRIVNMDDMQARVSQAIRDQSPGFFTGDQPGKISEFLPVTTTKWQAFAELNGRVVARIEVPSDSRIKPTVESLDGSSTEAPTTATCTQDQKTLDKKQLSDCIAQFARELAGRN